jgi:phasin
MAKDPSQFFEIPNEMRALAEKSVEQARQAFDSFMSAAHGTASALEGQAAAVRKGSEDIRQRAIAFAEHNVTSSFDFAHRLVRAKDLQEVIALQTEYVKAQIKTLTEQAKELGEAASQAAKDATKSKGLNAAE